VSDTYKLTKKSGDPFKIIVRICIKHAHEKFELALNVSPQ